MDELLINKKATKKFILAKLETLRPGWKCTRVSREALEKIDSHLRAMICRMVETHPSIGKTFVP